MNALLAGSAIGTIIFFVGIPAGIQPVQMTFVGTLILFGFTSLSLLVFSIIGWPQHSMYLDFYDFSKIIIGLALSIISAGILFAASLKIAALFSIDKLAAFSIALGFLLVYMTMAYSLVLLARRRGRALRRTN